MSTQQDDSKKEVKSLNDQNPSDITSIQTNEYNDSVERKQKLFTFTRVLMITMYFLAFIFILTILYFNLCPAAKLPPKENIIPLYTFTILLLAVPMAIHLAMIRNVYKTAATNGKDDDGKDVIGVLPTVFNSMFKQP